MIEIFTKGQKIEIVEEKETLEKIKKCLRFPTPTFLTFKNGLIRTSEIVSIWERSSSKEKGAKR